MSTVSALGIGSGFLNNELVDDLAEARRAPVEQRLEFQEQETEAKLSAFGQIQSAVTEMRLPARQLSDPTAIQRFEGNSSSGAVDVEVDSAEASRGSFSVDVEQVATAQSLATSSDDLFADRDSEAVGTGELTFEVGDRAETITLDEDNNTLNGLANAINEADVGVSANILDTGDGFRLVLNGDETGVANEINITADGDEALQRFDTGDLGEEDSFLVETREAQNARVNIDGVEIERSDNTIDGVIDGVTLNINEETTTPAQVDVQQDLQGPTEQVQELVDRFNELQQTVTEFTEFDTEEEEGSILTGDSAVRNTMNQIRRDLGQVVPGLEDASVRSLADVGISTDFQTGELEFDTNRFQEQLQQNPDDVAALFANQGRTSDGQVEFVRSGSETQAGEFDINVEEAATRGSFTGDAVAFQDDEITIDETNNTFSLSLNDGNEAEITLDEGTFSRQALVDQIQQQVRDNPVIDASGDRLNVSLSDNDELEFVSDRFGSESSVEILEGNDDLGLTAGEGEVGTDIVGTIDGREAQGDGQVLFLGRGEGDASGIQVRVGGDQTGDRGTVSFIEGVGGSVVDRINDLQGEDGALTARSDSFRNELDEIEENRQNLNDRIESFRERLVSQFTAADQRISQFEETGNFLAEQLAGLSGNN